MVPLLSAHMQEIWFCTSHRKSSRLKATEGTSASAEQKLLERALKKEPAGNIPSDVLHSPVPSSLKPVDGSCISQCSVFLGFCAQVSL